MLTAYTQHTIRVEYFEQMGSAVARLYWSGPNGPEQIVPRANLFLPLISPGTRRPGSPCRVFQDISIR